MSRLRKCQYCGEVSDAKTNFCRRCRHELSAEGTEDFLKQCEAYEAEEKVKVINKKMAKVALWNGIFSLLLMWQPILSMLTAVISAILGCIVVKKKKDGFKMGQASVCMAILSLFLMTFVYGVIGTRDYGGEVVDAICICDYDGAWEALLKYRSAFDYEISKARSMEELENTEELENF